MRTNDITRKTTEAGFTISELSVAILISFVVLLAGYALLEMVSTSAYQVQARAIAEEESRLGMERIGRELRQAEEVLVADSDPEVRTAFAAFAARDLTFYSDVDRDDVPERVRYYVSGSRLLRSVAQPSANPPTTATYGAETLTVPDLVTGLKSDWAGPVFTYWAQSTTAGVKVPTTVAAQISAVDVELYNGSAAGGHVSFVDLTSEIRIRSVNSSLESLP